MTKHIAVSFLAGMVVTIVACFFTLRGYVNHRMRNVAPQAERPFAVYKGVLADYKARAANNPHSAETTKLLLDASAALTRSTTLIEFLLFQQICFTLIEGDYLGTLTPAQKRELLNNISLGQSKLTELASDIDRYRLAYTKHLLDSEPLGLRWMEVLTQPNLDAGIMPQIARMFSTLHQRAESIRTQT